MTHHPARDGRSVADGRSACSGCSSATTTCLPGPATEPGSPPPSAPTAWRRPETGHAAHDVRSRSGAPPVKASSGRTRSTRPPLQGTNVLLAAATGPGTPPPAPGRRPRAAGRSAPRDQHGKRGPLAAQQLPAACPRASPGYRGRDPGPAGACERAIRLGPRARRRTDRTTGARGVRRRHPVRRIPQAGAVPGRRHLDAAEGGHAPSRPPRAPLPRQTRREATDDLTAHQRVEGAGRDGPAAARTAAARAVRSATPALWPTPG